MYNNFLFFFFISNDITIYATNCNTATYNFAFEKNRQTRTRKADKSVARIEENSFKAKLQARVKGARGQTP